MPGQYLLCRDKDRLEIGNDDFEGPGNMKGGFQAGSEFVIRNDNSYYVVQMGESRKGSHTKSNYEVVVFDMANPWNYLSVEFSGRCSDASFEFMKKFCCHLYSHPYLAPDIISNREGKILNAMYILKKAGIDPKNLDDSKVPEHLEPAYQPLITTRDDLMEMDPEQLKKIPNLAFLTYNMLQIERVCVHLDIASRWTGIDLYNGVNKEQRGIEEARWATRNAPLFRIEYPYRDLEFKDISSLFYCPISSGRSEGHYWQYVPKGNDREGYVRRFYVDGAQLPDAFDQLQRENSRECPSQKCRRIKERGDISSIIEHLLPNMLWEEDCIRAVKGMVSWYETQDSVEKKKFRMAAKPYFRDIWLKVNSSDATPWQKQELSSVLNAIIGKIVE